jgi:hypothetical protein
MKEIPLTRGKVALVDDEDYDFLNQWKWYCSDEGYAVRNIWLANGRHGAIKMHRAINQTPEGLETDHINHDRLDNQRANLRTATTNQNQWNQKTRKNNNSHGIKGVCWHKRAHKWEAHITAFKKQHHLGYFTDVEEAAQVYKEAAIKYFGEFAS